jgi:hypothetical protein
MDSHQDLKEHRFTGKETQYSYQYRISRKERDFYVLRRVWYKKPGYQPVLYKLRKAIEEKPESIGSHFPAT